MSGLENGGEQQPEGFGLRRERWRQALLPGVTALYIAIVIIADQSQSGMFTSLAATSALVGWQFGLIALGEASGAPSTVPLSAAASRPFATGLLAYGLLGIIVLLGTAVAVQLRRMAGRVRRQAEQLARHQQRVRRETAKRRRAEQALQQVRSEIGKRVAEQTSALLRANEQLERERAQRRRTEVAMREREELLRAVIDFFPHMTTISSPGGTIAMQSPAIETILGYSAAEYAGKNIFELVHPDDQFMLKALHTMLIERKVRASTARVRMRQADGGWRIVECRAKLLSNSQGQAAQILTVTRDMHEWLQLQRALEHARSRAERASQAKNAFLSRMSHELRTPLNAILGFAQIMQIDELPQPHRESAEHILKAGKHVLDLINEVLDIARIEAGHADLSCKPLYLPALLQETIDLVRPLAAQRHLAIELKPDEAGEQFVCGSEQRLKQVLLNLLSNAIKYNREHGWVRIATTPVGEDRLRISISDSGIGIDPAKQRLLFTPFERLGAEHTGIEGTGLGLALSQRLVEAMGGTIGIESDVGRGSTFWIELPRMTIGQEQRDRTVGQPI